MRLAIVILVGLTVTGCGGSGSTPAQKTEKAPATPPVKRHPLWKYLEISGIRISEHKAGELRVKFALINHSRADIGELTLHVSLRTSTAKPGDPPVVEFDAKTSALGPEEAKEVTATAATKLRAYELPDWQFLRAEFDVTSPSP